MRTHSFFTWLWSKWHQRCCCWAGFTLRSPLSLLNYILKEFWCTMMPALYVPLMFIQRWHMHILTRPGKSVQCSSDPEFACFKCPQLYRSFSLTWSVAPVGWWNNTKYLNKKELIPVPYTNMAAISLFWYTNMAAVTSDENDLLVVKLLRKQNNLQILLTGYEEHFVISK
jgi:hypothetical protein